MDIGSLLHCFADPGCITVQLVNALIIAMILFLVASGLTLILGVLGVLNFAHGSLYMMGAYFTYTVMKYIGNFGLALIIAPIGVGILGVILERFFIRRVYGLDELYQLLLTYAFILVFDDIVKLIWGIFDLSVTMPPAFRRPPHQHPWKHCSLLLSIHHTGGCVIGHWDMVFLVKDEVWKDYQCCCFGSRNVNVRRHQCAFGLYLCVCSGKSAGRPGRRFGCSVEVDGAGDGVRCRH